MYETLPLNELRQVARARGLKGISSLRKADLIEVMLSEDKKIQSENSIAEEKRLKKVMLKKNKKTTDKQQKRIEREILRIIEE